MSSTIPLPPSSGMCWDWRSCAGVFGAALTVLRNLARYHLRGERDLSPLYVVWHVTLRCNLRCEFCDDAKGRKYPDVRYPELGTADGLRLINLIRAACRSIYFTGGEPFVRSDFPELLRYSRQLGFWPIGVNTNLSLWEPLQAALRNHDIDVLVASLGSTDESKYDVLLGGRCGQTARILENLSRSARWQAEGGPRVVVNCLISAGRVQDARSVLAFCHEKRLWFSPIPEIHSVYVDPALLASPEYQHLVDDILEAKKRGDRIYGSLRGLETLLRARVFRCYPTQAPQLYPNGDLFYPCKPLWQITANVLEQGSFKRAWSTGRERFSPMPSCDNRCHLACYVNDTQWMEHPVEIAHDNCRLRF